MPSATLTGFASQFQEQGWALAKGVFSGHEIAELESEFDRIVSQVLASSEDANARWTGESMERLAGANDVVLHTHNVQQYSAAWLRALLHEPLLDLARAILGPDIVLHHTKLFQKPPEIGAPFPVHQDWGYFPTERDSMLAAVIHVSRATDEMGCLRVFSGSHKLGRMADAMGATDRNWLVDYPLEQALPIEAEPGDVLFFHYLTLHGSMPNRSPDTRKTVLVQMHSGQDRVEPGNAHPNEALVLSGWNHRMTRDTANRAE